MKNIISMLILASGLPAVAQMPVSITDFQAAAQYREYDNLEIISGVTYAQDIQPILASRCISCHSPKGGQPPFTSYSEVKNSAGMILQMVKEGKMPHGATNRYNTELKCTNPDVFQGSRKLSRREVSVINSWINAKFPRGEGERDLKKMAASSKNTGILRSGKPQIIVGNNGFVVPPTDGKTDILRAFIIDHPEMKVDRHISGFEIMPGSELIKQEGIAKVVHHEHLFIDRSCCDANDQNKSGCTPKSILQEQDYHKKVSCDTQAGFSGEFQFDKEVLAPWFPGGKPISYPDGVAVKVPACAKLVLQVHYVNTSDKPVFDNSIVAIRLLKGDVQKELKTKILRNTNLLVPANEPNYVISAQTKLTEPMEVYAFYPHMHLLGKEFLLQAHFTQPEKRSESLLDVTWDFDHQNELRYVHPRTFPEGTVLEIMGRYDNSVQNPRQFSNPPHDVPWGDNATNEMFQMMITYAKTITSGNVNKTFPKIGKFEFPPLSPDRIGEIYKQIQSCEPLRSPQSTTAAKVVTIGQKRSKAQQKAHSIEHHPERFSPLE